MDSNLLNGYIPHTDWCIWSSCCKHMLAIMTTNHVGYLKCTTSDLSKNFNWLIPKIWILQKNDFKHKIKAKIHKWRVCLKKQANKTNKNKDKKQTQMESLFETNKQNKTKTRQNNNKNPPTRSQPETRPPVFLTGSLNSGRVKSILQHWRLRILQIYSHIL